MGLFSWHGWEVRDIIKSRYSRECGEEAPWEVMAGPPAARVYPAGLLQNVVGFWLAHYLVWVWYQFLLPEAEAGGSLQV